MLRLNEISKTFKVDKKNTIKAVDSLSFDLTAGQIVGLLGNNGSGKTTTIKMIAGLTYPDNGNIFVNKFNIRKEPDKALKELGVILEGNRNLRWRLTIEENCRYFGALNMIDKNASKLNMKKYMDYFDLSAKEKSLVGNLSRGMQQKACLMVALIKNPKILLLDEPFNGLDVASRRKLLSSIKNLAKEEGIAILVTSHQIDYIEEICERVIILDHGKKIIEDDIENLISNFQKSSYTLVFKGAFTPLLVDELKNIISNIQIPIEENEIIKISFVCEESTQEKLIWEILQTAREHNLLPLSLECGRPELTYVYEELLRSREVSYA